MDTFTLSKEVSDEKFNRIISIESAGNPDAGPPKGSAGGLGQFLNLTWDDVGQKHYPALKKKYGAAWRAMRKGKKTATLQLLMLARFTEDNVRALGKGWDSGDLYLAHFLGIGDARKVFHASPDARMESLVQPKALENNPSILPGKTAGQVRAWAQRAMDTRWPKLGSKDWVAIWYNAQEAAAYLGQPAVLGEEDETPVKPEEVDEADEAATPPAEPDPVSTVPGVRGDPDIWIVQSMLKPMNYNPGGLDGVWGGMTAEAITGFITDRNLEIPVPKTMDEFCDVRNELKAELTRAAGYKRPVSAERANADEKKITEVAPEVAPVQRNATVTIWGAVGAFFASAWSTVSGWVSDLWGFLTDNEDKIPDSFKEKGTLASLWDWVTGLPVGIWFAALGVGLVFIYVNSRSAINKITEDVKSGARK